MVPMIQFISWSSQRNYDESEGGWDSSGCGRETTCWNQKSMIMQLDKQSVNNNYKQTISSLIQLNID